MPEKFIASFADWLNGLCRGEEAKNGDRLIAGTRGAPLSKA